MCTTTAPRRTIALIDIENFLAKDRSMPSLRRVLARCMSIVEPTADDQVVVATGHCFATAAAFELVGPRTRFLVGAGKDGADHALLDFIDVAHSASRFDRLVIGSGDGIFADLASQAQRAGMRVTVVAAPCDLSARLRLCADRVVDFDSPRFALPHLPAAA